MFFGVWVVFLFKRENYIKERNQNNDGDTLLCQFCFRMVENEDASNQAAIENFAIVIPSIGEFAMNHLLEIAKVYIYI